MPDLSHTTHFKEEVLIGFYHSDEDAPFLSVWTDKVDIDMEAGVARVYSRDYEHPVLIVHEWDYCSALVEDADEDS